MIVENISRRLALSLIGAGGASAFLAGCNRAAILSTKTVGIGLFTVRDLMAKDPMGTLKALADIGFTEVEFSALGYYGYQPADMRTRLADLGIVSPSRLIRLRHVRGELSKTLDDASAAGHKYLVLAYLKKSERSHLDQYKEYVDLFSRVGEQARKQGIRFGYHSHEFEFEALDGVVPYDLMLEQIAPEHMSCTMDLYWFARAKADPFAYIDKYPGRFTQCHIKDKAKDAITQVDPGTGVVDFEGVIAMSEKAGFKHFYIEDKRRENVLARSNDSFKYASKIVRKLNG